MGILQKTDLEYISEVKHFIKRERIEAIYFVNDTSCRFINAIINKNELFGLPAEREIEELYVEHYYSDFEGQSLFNQKNKLAELNIRTQANEILNSSLLGSFISKFGIEIKVIITSKGKRMFKEIRIENYNSKVYEL